MKRSTTRRTLKAPSVSERIREATRIVFQQSKPRLKSIEFIDLQVILEDALAMRLRGDFLRLTLSTRNSGFRVGRTSVTLL